MNQTKNHSHILIPAVLVGVYMVALFGLAVSQIDNKDGAVLGETEEVVYFAENFDTTETGFVKDTWVSSSECADNWNVQSRALTLKTFCGFSRSPIVFGSESFKEIRFESILPIENLSQDAQVWVYRSGIDTSSEGYVVGVNKNTISMYFASDSGEVILLGSADHSITDERAVLNVETESVLDEVTIRAWVYEPNTESITKPTIEISETSRTGVGEGFIALGGNNDLITFDNIQIVDPVTDGSVLGVSDSESSIRPLTLVLLAGALIGGMLIGGTMEFNFLKQVKPIDSKQEKKMFTDL